FLKDNFSVLSESEKEDFLNKVNDIFSDINFYTCYYGISDEKLTGISYNNELILKGLLLKSTSAIINAVYNSPDAEIRNTYISLKQLRNSIAGAQGSESNTDILKKLEDQANEMEKKLVKFSSEFAGIHHLFEYRWEDVRGALKTDEAAIEFISFQEGLRFDTTVYGAIIITSDCKYPKTIRLFEESELNAMLGKATGTGYMYINKLYDKNSKEMYKLIWEPMEKELSGINTVYYAPVGALNKISFAALSKEPGNMLCDIYNIQQVSTTGKLIKQELKSELKMTAAVFGGIDYNTDSVKLEAWKYLPCTLNEKNSIEKQLKKNKIACRGFSGKEAKEEQFKELFDSTDTPSILHVSTHGFFYPDPKQLKKEAEAKEEKIDFRGSSGFGNWMFLNNKNPMMRSGLVFAGANRVWSEDWGRTDNEGVLTAYEVSNMNMRNTDLVVLSACETGLGDIKGSEGVYGLQRAFKMAGVKYIIMSLWQVPDKETVEFMEMFYKKLLKEKDVRMAFNETQKEMRKKYDPYFWAAFVLIE
ncbi:MAG: CHAT domain-containing protein, partial [Bacteroidota bacterium]